MNRRFFVRLVIAFILLALWAGPVSGAPESDSKREVSTILEKKAVADKFLNRFPSKSDLISYGKKGPEGGDEPLPPGDPICPAGTQPVGPVTDQTFSRDCTIEGKKGKQICKSKFQHCMGDDPNGPDYAYTENCGPCAVLPEAPAEVLPGG